MKISNALVNELDLLCMECPKGEHRESCPFKIIAGLSRASRRSLFAAMEISRVEGIFDLAEHCRCPADPRNKKLKEAHGLVEKCD